MSKTESPVSRHLKKRLQEVRQSGAKMFFERNHVGSLMIGGVTALNPSAGKADFSMIYAARYYELETKSQTGQQRENQRFRQKQIEYSGGKYYILNTIAKVDQFIKEIFYG